MNAGLSFVRGIAAAVNPCGFILLPTYLMYFLGLEAARADSERASVRRALLVGGAVSAGFMAVFVVIGALANAFGTWVYEQAKYVTGVAGAVLLVIGVAMLFGFKLRLALPSLAVDRRDTTVRSMFVYGVVYATVSLSCTVGLFIPMLFDRGGVTAGVVNGGAYALGMGLLVTALTVSLAVANRSLLRLLRAAMQHVQLVAAAFVLLSGAYLLHYFWVVDVNEGSSGLTDAMSNFQVRVSSWLTGDWRVVGLVLAVVVAAAAGYAGLRRRPGAERSVASPTREPTS